MTPTTDQDGRPRSLTGSIIWGYGFGFLLMLFVVLILVPEAGGPSPWDPVAFRSAILELAANLKILDELADLGLVRVADVGTGLLNVDLDLLAVSNRQFGVAPFYLALAFMALSLALRGFRQRLLATHFGFAATQPGLFTSYFLGRGMNLFFPFGPGELAVARALDGREGTTDAAGAVAFHNRAFELLAILVVMLVGMGVMGWGGAVTAVLWTMFLMGAVVSLTRPLGWVGTEGESRRRWNFPARIWDAFHGPGLTRALLGLRSAPGLLGGMLVVSLVALSLEILSYWLIKQAFSSPLDDYVLMKDITLLQFTVVTAGAAMTRIVPYTFASFGIYEAISVIMFWVVGQGFLAGLTVTLLDVLLHNIITLAFFIIAMRLTPFPSLLDTWRLFVRQSALRPPAG